jgi:hypothetical protein
VLEILFLLLTKYGSYSKEKFTQNFSGKERVVMKREFEKVDSDRRALIFLGLAGASALVVGKASELLAGEKKAGEEKASEKGVKEIAKGVKDKMIQEAESVIPGYSKVRLSEMTFQPGASIKGKMPNAMVCEMTRGAVEDTIDGVKNTRKKGGIWTCKTGQEYETVNKGKTPAVMRYYDLLT